MVLIESGNAPRRRMPSRVKSSRQKVRGKHASDRRQGQPGKFMIPTFNLSRQNYNYLHSTIQSAH